METYSREETILLATSNKEIIEVVEELAIKNKKKVYYAEPNSPDILAIPCFCIVGDKEFIGIDNLQTFYEITSEHKDKDSITFLHLIEELTGEIIKQKIIEAEMKIKGIYMYPHKKKHRIMIHGHRSYGYSHSPADVDSFDELKEIMKLEKAYSIVLGYYDIFDNSPNIHDCGIKPVDFTEAHFNWLIVDSKGMSRFIELN